MHQMIHLDGKRGTIYSNTTTDMYMLVGVCSKRRFFVLDTVSYRQKGQILHRSLRYAFSCNDS